MIPNIKVTTAMRYVKKVTASRIKDAVKKRKKQQSEQAVSQLINNSTSPSDPTKRMSSRHLSIVLSCICPHTLDDSYKSSEECLTKDGCMLCDMRDLAHCALVNKKWYMAAQPLLYRNVRIEAVHYCELEIELSSKRKRNSAFIDRDGKRLDIPQTRLRLFMRTVRESQQLADTVLSLRLPYMTREASKADLARTVSVLRYLQYVDLPVGFFSDDPSSYTLKQELMAKCPNLRRMAYTHGSEMSFAHIPGSNLWRGLQSLELSELLDEEGILRQVLGSFPALRSLKMERLPSVGDTIFTPTSSLPMFPPVAQLRIRNIPTITADGLATHLSIPQNQRALETLVLAQSGIRPESLHTILSQSPNLVNFTFELDVERSFPAREVSLLASKSVRTMHYEIASTSSPRQALVSSYYDYLMHSLHSNSLPALRRLYVLDPRFPDRLRRFCSGGGEGGEMKSLSLPSGPGLQQPLTLYTKGMDEFEWNITQYEPLSGKRTSTTRPVSLHSAHSSPQWGGEARQSVVLGNGFGGFLAVPVDDGRPTSGNESKRDSKYDLWR